MAQESKIDHVLREEGVEGKRWQCCDGGELSGGRVLAVTILGRKLGGKKQTPKKKKKPKLLITLFHRISRTFPAFLDGDATSPSSLKHVAVLLKEIFTL